jgi:mercuric ion transport protein
MKPSKLAMTTGGSVVSAILSFLPLSCCAFPAAFSFLAAGGLASATALVPYRPYFIALTFVFLGAGFYFAYWPQSEQRALRARCAMSKSRMPQRASLWAITLAAIVLIAFPYLLPYL